MNARAMARPARRWAEPAARVGYTAKGIVHVVVGGIAVRAALGWGGRATDTRGALQTMGEPGLFGTLLLPLVAAGLFAYVFWRLAQALLDLDRKGDDARGLLARAGFLGSGFAYAGLALTAAQMAMGGAGGGRDEVRLWTARALADPDRWWLVVATGVGVASGGLFQFYKAHANRFEEHLALSRISAQGRRWVRRVGRVGLVARGVTLGVIGWFLVLAGMHVDAGEAHGLGGALRALRQADYGPWLLGGVGVGLAAYGLFSMVEGRFRRIG
ncbi:MAG TPA: DUF1206 domain-containing protein [Vicinamibacteria bacterium]|nr:DUF1206 domain-containing protein [Vicinamibacteria bacterium]